MMMTERSWRRKIPLGVDIIARGLLETFPEDGHGVQKMRLLAAHTCGSMTMANKVFDTLCKSRHCRTLSIRWKRKRKMLPPVPPVGPVSPPSPCDACISVADPQYR